MSLFNELPSTYSNEDSKNRYGVVKALSDTLDEMRILIEDSIKQRFFSTATGQNITNLAKRYGFPFRKDDGSTAYTLNLIRKVAPLTVFTPQTVSASRVLEAFFGVTATRVNILCIGESPFDIINKSLILEHDGEKEVFSFSDSYFGSDDITIDDLILFFNRSDKTKAVKYHKDFKTYIVLLSNARVFKVLGGTANISLYAGDVEYSAELTPIELSGNVLTADVKATIGSYITLRYNNTDHMYKIINFYNEKIVLDKSTSDEYIGAADVIVMRDVSYSMSTNNTSASYFEFDNNIRFVLPLLAQVELDNPESGCFIFQNKYHVDTLFQDEAYSAELPDCSEVSFFLQNKYIKTKITTSSVLNGRVNIKGILPSQKKESGVLKNTPHSVELQTQARLVVGSELTIGYSLVSVLSTTRDGYLTDLTPAHRELITGEITSEGLHLIKIRFNEPHSLREKDIIHVTHMEIAKQNIVGSKITVRGVLSPLEVLCLCDRELSLRPVGSKAHIKIYSSGAIEFEVNRNYLYNDLSIYTIHDHQDALKYFFYSKQPPSSVHGMGEINQNKIQVSTIYTFPSSGVLALSFGTHNESLVEYSHALKISNGYILTLTTDTNIKARLPVRLIIDTDITKNPYIYNPYAVTEECVKILKTQVPASVKMETEIISVDFINADKLSQ